MKAFQAYSNPLYSTDVKHGYWTMTRIFLMYHAWPTSLQWNFLNKPWKIQHLHLLHCGFL